MKKFVNAYLPAMKILIVVGSFKTGGAERMSINTGEELIKRGHDVYYIVQRPIFEIPNSIPLEKIVVLRKEKRSDFFYKISSLFYGVFSESRKIKPDAVIAFTRFSSFLACFTFSKNIIARFDMNPYKLSKKQRVWADFVLNFPSVKRVIVPSTGMLEALQAIRPKFSQKFEVIPNSIKSETVIERAKDTAPAYSFEYITAMGRLSKQKNFELLIKGFSLSKLKDKFKLLIIGDGNLKDSLESIVKSQGVQEQVVFTGQLKNPFPVIAQSKFFVNTSIHESFCNVILEALTLSKPVIATDCNYGPSDMIMNHQNGFLIENDNLNALVEKLDELGSDDSKMAEFAINAKESSYRFNIEHIGNLWEDLLKRI